MPNYGRFVNRLPPSTAPELARAISDVWREQEQIFAKPTFVPGNTTASVGSTARIDYLFENNSVDQLVYSAGIWPSGLLYIHAGVSKSFDDVLVNSTGGAPFVTLFAKGVNNGTDADVVAMLCETVVAQSSQTGFGLNVIVRNDSGTTSTKLIGCEIDVQPASGYAPTECGGLYINAFTEDLPGPAIYIEGIFGGTWGTGLSVGNLSNNGAGIGPAAGTPSMGTLVDSGTATYQIDAIKLSNTHKIRFSGTSTTHAKIQVDSSNFWKFILGSNSLVFRNSSDTTTLVSIDTGGNINLENSGTIYWNGSLSSSSATAGANTLPSNPVGFITVNIGGTNRKIPYYAT